MINDGINNVPDKTITIFPQNGWSYDNLENTIKKPNKKRDWFAPFFYNCLPLAIGNQYGFVISPNFDFNVMWNGGLNPEDVSITMIHEKPLSLEEHSLLPQGHFGHGILTIVIPFIMRTPPGINLMTINPPNYIINNATVLTGVVEADNLRMAFTVNLKIHEPNRITSFKAGEPLAAIMPIPRYFGDKFELVNCSDIFSKEIVDEENNISKKHEILRFQNIEKSKNNNLQYDKLYFKGKDIDGNEFLDHQR
jgi:hypothetical protein